MDYINNPNVEELPAKFHGNPSGTQKVIPQDITQPTWSSQPNEKDTLVPPKARKINEHENVFLLVLLLRFYQTNSLTTQAISDGILERNAISTSTYHTRFLIPTKINFHTQQKSKCKATQLKAHSYKNIKTQPFKLETLPINSTTYLSSKFQD